MKTQYRMTTSTFMMIAVGVALGLWFSRSGGGTGTHLWVVGLFLLFPWVAAPWKLRYGHTQSARPNFVVFDPATPSAIASRVRAAEDALEPLGFVAVKGYTLDALLKNTTGFVTLFRNERTGEAIKLIGVKSQSQVATVESSTLAFTSEFADGTEIITSNSRVPKLVPPFAPPIFVMVFPDLRDPAGLYTVHRARVADMMPAARQTDAIGNDPDSFLRRTEFRAHDHQILCGYFQLDEGRQVLRPTWKGAVLMSWKLLWPVGPLRAYRRRQVAWKELSRLGLVPIGGGLADPSNAPPHGSPPGRFLADRPAP